eukprot:Selendium_serpulae@DN7128_c0_g1_i1.p1
MFLSNRGEVFSFGHGPFGQLGIGYGGHIVTANSHHPAQERGTPSRNDNIDTDGPMCPPYDSQARSVVCREPVKLRNPTISLNMRFGDVSWLGVKEIACGSFHSVALTHDGQVFTWGEATGCGHGTLDDVFFPRPVRDLQNVLVTTVAAGFNQT